MTPFHLRAAPVIAAVVSTIGIASAQAQAPAVTSEGGYTVTRTQIVSDVPAGSVGRKTTDTETRVGNTPETNGRSRTSVMTVGGFANSCPSDDGIVPGSFEYVLNVDEVNGVTERATTSEASSRPSQDT